MGEGARGVEIIAIVSHTDMEISYTIAGTIGREEEGARGGEIMSRLMNSNCFAGRGYGVFSPSHPLSRSPSLNRGGEVNSPFHRVFASLFFFFFPFFGSSISATAAAAASSSFMLLFIQYWCPMVSTLLTVQ